MTLWIGFLQGERRGFGRLEGDRIAVHDGDLFASPAPTGEVIDLAQVTIDVPCRPTKLLALWKNFHSAIGRQGLTVPDAPLAFIKTANSYRPSGATIKIPAIAGRVLYEGELGIVIGHAARDLSEDAAGAHIFGYTCVNDVTAPSIMQADASFAQWTRAKGLDGFCPFGPVIATGLDPATLVVRTLVNGRERQNYPIVDMVFSAPQLVAHLSQGMTLEPGDIIACGTSNGAGPIPKGATVEVVIEGIGCLSNRFE